MQIPSYGATPLSATFLMVRVMQVISMIAIIGMTGNFINDIVMNMQEAPQEIVGTLSVACIATLYTLVSIAFYWSIAKIGLFVMAAIDSLLLIAFIVVAVDFGKPLFYLNCYANRYNTSSDPLTYAFAVDSSVAGALQSATGSIVQRAVSALTSRDGMVFSFFNLATQTTSARCFETKIIWALSIALCLLFTTSVFLLPTLFYKNKKAPNAVKDAA